MLMMMMMMMMTKSRFVEHVINGPQFLNPLSIRIAFNGKAFFLISKWL